MIMWHSTTAVAPAQTERTHHIITHWMHDTTPVWVAQAPGRLDVMGGIADYSGSLVLQWPLDVVATAYVQRRSDQRVHVVSLATELQGQMTATFALADIQHHDYVTVRQHIQQHPQTAWAAYMAGVVTVLYGEAGITFAGGLTIVIDSHVPLSKGVSSSAAIEVATMRALLALADREIDGRTIALWCQKAENHVVGAPCGVMDQMASACGLAQQFMALRCQPAELLPAVALPRDLAVWGIDSGVRHAVSGADYGAVRIGAFMGYRMIAAHAGVAVSYRDGVAVIDDPRWHGYLANIRPSEFVQTLAQYLPDVIRGDEFLARYSATSDVVTTVKPDTVYAVRQPTWHPIAEHHRVQLFAHLLQQTPCTEQTAMLLGELMYQSHASYSACGLGATATDAIVEAIRTHGPAHGLYGAKITGGGSGGTVAVLGRPEALPLVRRIAEQHATGLVFTGSSDGAVARAVVKWVAQ